MVARLTKSFLPLAILALALANLPARASDRITLRNGFSYDCARHQAIDTGHTRLFLESGANASYIDIPTDEIVAVDALPTPPPIPAQTAAANATTPPDLHSLIAAAGQAHNIDVELLASVIHAESGGNPQAVSRTGAGGLMQLMPGTAHQLGVADAFQPDQNIRGGTTYLDALLTRYHDNLALALAAYNAGPGAVDHFHGIPPFHETRAYVYHVMSEFKRRKLALQHNPTLQASR